MNFKPRRATLHNLRANVRVCPSASPCCGHSMSRDCQRAWRSVRETRRHILSPVDSGVKCFWALRPVGLWNFSRRRATRRWNFASRTLDSLVNKLFVTSSAKEYRDSSVRTLKRNPENKIAALSENTRRKSFYCERIFFLFLFRVQFRSIWSKEFLESLYSGKFEFFVANYPHLMALN